MSRSRGLLLKNGVKPDDLPLDADDEDGTLLPGNLKMAGELVFFFLFFLLIFNSLRRSDSGLERGRGPSLPSKPEEKKAESPYLQRLRVRNHNKQIMKTMNFSSFEQGW